MFSNMIKKEKTFELKYSRAKVEQLHNFKSKFLHEGYAELLQQGFEVKGHRVLIVAGKSGLSNLSSISIKMQRSVMEKRER